MKIFTSILSQKEVSYADSFNADVSMAGINCDYCFFKKINTEKGIEDWIKKLKSRIVMKEDYSSIENIIDDYIECG